MDVQVERSGHKRAFGDAPKFLPLRGGDSRTVRGEDFTASVPPQCLPEALPGHQTGGLFHLESHKVYLLIHIKNGL